MDMTIQFDPNQPFRLDAVAAVIESRELNRLLLAEYRLREHLRARADPQGPVRQEALRRDRRRGRVI